MGVLTSHVSSEFFLPARHKEAALKSLQNFVRRSSSPEDYVYDPDEAIGAATIGAALRAAGLMTSENGEGDVVDLVWGSDKLPFDTYTLASLLDSLARFVRAGSYLEIEEEFCHCKITFRDGHASHDYTRYDAYDGSIARAKRVIDTDERDRAVGDLIYATEVEPEYCMAWVELANVHAQQRRWADAAEACERAIAAPQKVYKGPSYTLDYTETAYAAYLHNADYLVGENAVRAGEYLVAIPHLQRAARALPKVSTVFWELAKALYEARRYSETLEAAQEVLTREPTHTYGLFYSALSLHHMARPAEAMEHFAKLSKRSPTWLYPLCVYAEAASDAGDLKKVNQLCERIRKRAAKEIAGKYERDIAWGHASLAHVSNVQGRWAEAETEAAQARSVFPDNGYLLNLLGVALLMQGKTDEAIPILERCAEAHPLWEIPKYNLGRCYLSQGRTEEGGRLIEAAVAINARLERRPDWA